MLLSIHLCIYFFIQTLTTLCLRENQIGDKGAQHLAIALQQNKVTWVRLCFFVFTIHSLFAQTLIVLNLGWNQIGDEGAQHLANALQQNKVTLFRLCLFVFIYAFVFFKQTLTTLELEQNRIGGEGAKYLASALQQNKVTSSTLSSFPNYLFTFSYRHSSHYTSRSMISVMREHNI
jgi:Ran GTPase-activating protein (RanGAP) involved in mRNA processing and transport